MKKLTFFVLTALVLTACKTEIEKEVSLKTLLNEPIKTEIAILNVELISCNSHEDSRQPSSSLIDVQTEIPKVFPQAKYKECYSKRSDSFAVFEIPVGIGKAGKEQIFENDITIYSFGKRILNIKTSDRIAQNISDFAKKDRFNKLDFRVTLNVKNDIGKELPMTVYSAYVDGFPVTISPEVNFPKDKIATFSLSNTSVDNLWKDGKGHFTLVISEPLNFKKVFNEE